MSIPLAVATKICDSVVNQALAKGWGPVCVHVVDAAAQPIAMQRMDGVALAYSSYSSAKANTCVLLGMNPRVFRDKYASGDPAKMLQATSMIASMKGTICAFPGGVLLRSQDEKIVAAVGVSGASSDQDEWLALSAARLHWEGPTSPSSSPLD